MREQSPAMETLNEGDEVSVRRTESMSSFGSELSRNNSVESVQRNGRLRRSRGFVPNRAGHVNDAVDVEENGGTKHLPNGGQVLAEEKGNNTEQEASAEKVEVTLDPSKLEQDCGQKISVSGEGTEGIESEAAADDNNEEDHKPQDQQPRKFKLAGSRLARRK